MIFMEKDFLKIAFKKFFFYSFLILPSINMIKISTYLKLIYKILRFLKPVKIKWSTFLSAASFNFETNSKKSYSKAVKNVIVIKYYFLINLFISKITENFIYSRQKS